MAWSMHSKAMHSKSRTEPAGEAERHWDRPLVVEPGQTASVHAPTAAELLEHPSSQGKQSRH